MRGAVYIPSRIPWVSLRAMLEMYYFSDITPQIEFWIERGNMIKAPTQHTISENLRDRLCVLEAALQNLKMPTETREYLKSEIQKLIQTAEIVNEQIELLKLNGTKG